MAHRKPATTFRFQITALVAAVVIAAVLYGMGPIGGKSADEEGGGKGAVSALAPFAVGAVGNFVPAREPMPVAPIAFVDAAGNELTLADFSGRTVLLNLWATWCTPCREEMPALDALQAQVGGDDVVVLALSLDKGGIEKPKEFLAEVGIRHLALYHDATGRMGTKLGAFGLPTTLLIGPDGRSLGRLVGPAQWDAPEARALIEAASTLSEPTS